MDPPADERDGLGVRVWMGRARVGLVARGGSRVEQSELRGRDQGRGWDPPRLHEQAGSLTLQPNHRQPTCHHSSTRDLPAPTPTTTTTTTESARGYISPPTRGGALARIISLSVPHWPMAAPYRGGDAAPVRRPHILHVATWPRSRRARVTGSMLKKPYKNYEPRTGTARPPLGKSRYEQPTGGDGA